jgi:hypothetical protein
MQKTPAAAGVMGSRSDLMQLEETQVFRRRRVGRAADEGRE